jgi:hypothetical protein
MPQNPTVDLRWNAILNDFRRSGLTHVGKPNQKVLWSCNGLSERFHRHEAFR